MRHCSASWHSWAKVYGRDSGLVHALLDIGDRETLLSHPIVGASWEGFVIDNLLSCALESVQGHFYRTTGGTEVDLLLAWPDGNLWAIEIKRSLSPKVERGFHAACDDLSPVRKLVVYPGNEPFPLGNVCTLCRWMCCVRSWQPTTESGPIDGTKLIDPDTGAAAPRGLRGARSKRRK